MNKSNFALNWKVGAALLVAGAGLWYVTRQPLSLVAFLPLVYLACPIGMGLMMWMMMRGMGAMGNAPSQPPQMQKPPTAVDTTPRSGQTRAERVADLRTQMADVQTQQQELAQELAKVDQSPPIASK